MNKVYNRIDFRIIMTVRSHFVELISTYPLRLRLWFTLPTKYSVSTSIHVMMLT